MAIDLSQYAGKYPQPVLDAVQAILTAKPEQIQQNTGPDGQFNLDGFLQSTLGWWQENGGQVANKLDQFGPEMQLLDALGYQVNGNALPAGAPTPQNVSVAPGADGTLNTTGGGVPIEQGLLQTALPGLITDVNDDANRRTLAGTLANQTLAGATAVNAQLARARGGHFDGRTYLAQNQDVGNAFNGLPDGTQPGTKVVNGQELTADQFAEQNYLNNGQREGRQPFYVQSAQLAQDFDNANQTTAANIASANQSMQAQLGALSTATQQLQQNLQGNLAAKAAALQQQLQTLNSNLDTLSAAQRAALTQQIATQQKDLEESITTQRQALQDQITALGSAATTQAQAQRDALEQEIQGLTAAQAPLAAARTAAADLQATAVNVGLQRTQDQLTAQNAQAGFVGGSTAQDTALARATIDARGRAAEAMGNANVANAQDTRDIGVHGATGQRTIADALAEAQHQIAGQSATGNAALTTGLATGRQQLGDTQATGLANIASNTAQTRAGIGAYGANTTYGNTTTGADQSRTISDALAQGQYGLTSTNAQQVQAAQNQGAAAKATYYDNDWNRSLSAALAPSTIAANTVGTLTALGNYGSSGLGRTQNLLNWWSTNPGAAPTPGAIATQPSTVGNSVSNLGAGLFSAGLNYGNANSWWQKPSVNGTATTSASSPTGYVTPGGNVGVQTDWSSALSCWVAREVYGAGNPKWLRFREWLLASAPQYLREFYLANGERIAREIRDAPDRISEIRNVMDKILDRRTA